MYPCDPVAAIWGLEASVELNEEMGFNRPIYEQYLSWISGAFQGNWGDSIFGFS